MSTDTLTKMTTSGPGYITTVQTLGNISENGTVSTFSEYSPDIAFMVCESCIALLAILLNSIIIAVIIRERRFHRISFHYIMSLSIADLLMGTIGIPFAIVVSTGQPGNFVACMFMNCGTLVVCSVSIFNLVGVAFDRYIAIRHYTYYTSTITEFRSNIIIATAWVFGILVGLVPMWWNNGEPPEPRCLFVEVIDLSFFVFFLIVGNLIPAAVMGVVYSRLFLFLHKRPRLNTAVSAKQAMTESRRKQRDVKMAVMLFILTSFFFISWTPLSVLDIFLQYCSPTVCDFSNILPVINSLIILTHSNAAVNPILYLVMSTDIREAVKRLLGFAPARRSSYSESDTGKNSFVEFKRGVSTNSNRSVFETAKVVMVRSVSKDMKDDRH